MGTSETLAAESLLVWLGIIENLCFRSYSFTFWHLLEFGLRFILIVGTSETLALAENYICVLDASVGIIIDMVGIIERFCFRNYSFVF